MSVAPLLLFVCLLASPTIASVHELGKNRACLPENVSKASAPVCARVTLRNQNKILATMHNRDVARCLGAGIQCNGPCPCQPGAGSSGGCRKTGEYDPVCGESGRTHYNAGVAKCAMDWVLCRGSCPCADTEVDMGPASQNLRRAERRKRVGGIRRLERDWE